MVAVSYRGALERWLIAAHEAAHAVVCVHLKVPFEYVTVVPDEKSEGRVFCLRDRDIRIRLAAPITNSDAFRFLSDQEIEIKAEKIRLRNVTNSIMTFLAAQEYCGTKSGCSGDEQNAIKLAESVGIDSNGLDRIRNKTKEIVSTNFIASAIRIVTDRLLEVDTLKAAEVRKIYREVKEEEMYFRRGLVKMI